MMDLQRNKEESWGNRSNSKFKCLFENLGQHQWDNYVFTLVCTLTVFKRRTKGGLGGVRRNWACDCGMFVCAFAEYVSHDMFDIFSRLFGVVKHQLRYDALIWDYVRRKQNYGAISESEATRNVISKHGGFKRSRKQFGSSRTR
ncbi:hypothetical protein BC332_02283 [Capsicum chinense]|nr:hypothetical protein BC332_02283 [Capsicum chinense]